MRGGYQVVADALNRAYSFPDGRTVTRQSVEAWNLGRVLNQTRQVPPSPVEEDPEAVGHGDPRYIFETDAWVEWARPGVPGRYNRGWVVPEPRSGS